MLISLAILWFPLLVSARTEELTIPKNPHCKFNLDEGQFGALECKDIEHRFRPSKNYYNCLLCDLKCDFCSFANLNASSFEFVENHKSNNIQNIAFKNSKVDRIASYAFQSLNYLREVNLKQVQLKYLEEDAFANLPIIWSINLSHNKLSQLPHQIFKEVTNSLDYLYLEHNHIRELHASSFSNLKSLKQLFLNNNQLCSIPLGAFDGLDQLGVLKLSFNKLKKLHKKMFVGLPQLHNLDLSNNQLVRINLHNFKYLESKLNQNLWLNLSSTSLHYLDGVHNADILTRLNIIDLRENIWSCSILENLVLSLENRGVEVLHGNNFKMTYVLGIVCLEGKSKENKLADENITYDQFRQIVAENPGNTPIICHW